MKHVHPTSEQGQTMAEYGVILAMITAGVILGLLAFSAAIQAGFARAIALVG
ncbi:MAG: Flp family type IVb pilin [Pseudomonadota bacterium]